jgi:hypothetical protein
MTSPVTGLPPTRRWLKPSIAVLVLGLVPVSLSLMLRRPTPANAAASPEALTQELQALRGEVAKLQANAQPKVYVVSPPPPRPLPLDDAPAPAGVAATAEPASPPSPEQRHAQTAAELQLKLESEAIDAAWSTLMVRELRETVSGAVPAARLLQTDCATSLCRIILGHDSEEEQRGLAHQVAAAKPFQEGVFYDYDQSQGALKTTLYVLRPGYSFDDSR